MAIRELDNGRYQVRVYLGTDPITHKVSYKKKTVKSKKEAILTEAQLLTQIDNGDLLPPWESSKPLEHYTFDMAYEEWFKVYQAKGFAKSTIDKTEQIF